MYTAKLQILPYSIQQKAEQIQHKLKDLSETNSKKLTHYACDIKLWHEN